MNKCFLISSLFLLFFLSCTTVNLNFEEAALPANSNPEEGSKEEEVLVPPPVEEPQILAINNNTPAESVSKKEIPDIDIPLPDIESNIEPDEASIQSATQSVTEPVLAEEDTPFPLILPQVEEVDIPEQKEPESNYDETSKLNEKDSSVYNHYTNYTQPLVESEPAAAVVGKTEEYNTSYTDTTDQKRKIFARLGDNIEIMFHEEGWIFSGFRDKDKEGLEFVSRKIEQGKTIFNINTKEIGTYYLEFQLQNNYNGTSSTQLVELEVIAEEDFSATLNESKAFNNRAAFEYADRLFELGQYEKALAEYLKAYAEGSAHLNERIAFLFSANTDFWNARLYWQKNLGAAEEYRDKAIIELTHAYINLDDYDSLLSHLPLLLDIKNSPIGAELAAVAQYFETKNSDIISLEMINHYLKRYPGGEYLDILYYLLGKIYEKDTRIKDYKKSRDYYKHVFKEFPESNYAVPAQERFDYINRHYFYVR